MHIRILRWATAGICMLIIWSFSANPPQRTTGAPGEGGCDNAGCHIGGAGIIDATVNIKGLPPQIRPNTAYQIEVEIIKISGPAERAGFQMTLLGDDQSSIGSFSNNGENTAISSTADREYLEHQPAQFFRQMDTIRYSSLWSLDEETNSDSIYLYLGANIANGNNNRSGDLPLFARQSYAITQDTGILISATIEDSGCEEANGSIVVAISGGLPPYSITWSTGDTTLSISDLPVGSYDVTVVDANEDSLSEAFMVGAQVDTVSPIIFCTADTFYISTCAPFSYSVPTATDDCGDVDIRLLSGRGINQPYPVGLSVEIYEATDASGNKSQCSIYINNQPEITSTINVIQPQCHNDSIGFIDLEITGSNPPYEISSELLGEDNSLPKGVHTITISDASGCSFTETVEIIRPQELNLTIDSVNDNTNSDDGNGQILISVTGGVMPYEYSWTINGQFFSDESDLTGLFSGVYQLTVSDSYGCLIVSDTVLVDLVSSIYDPQLSATFTLFPNPSNDQKEVFLTSPILNQVTSIELFDLLGQSVLTNKFQSKQDKLAISLTNIHEGLHYMKITLSDDRHVILPLVH